MITAKEAIANALKFAGELFADEKLLEPMLEEVELSDDGNWRVTFSFVRQPNRLAEALDASMTRVYKVFAVDRDTGEIWSMKIRQPV